MVVQNNNRRSNVHITYNGETLTLAEFVRKYAIPNGVDYKKFWHRYRKLNLDVEKCIVP